MTSHVVLGSILELLLPMGLGQAMDFVLNVVLNRSFSCAKKKIFELTSSSSSHVCNACGVLCVTVCNHLTFALSEFMDLVSWDPPVAGEMCRVILWGHHCDFGTEPVVRKFPSLQFQKHQLTQGGWHINI